MPRVPRQVRRGVPLGQAAGAPTGVPGAAPTRSITSSWISAKACSSSVLAAARSAASLSPAPARQPRYVNTGLTHLPPGTDPASSSVTKSAPGMPRTYSSQRSRTKSSTTTTARSRTPSRHRATASPVTGLRVTGAGRTASAVPAVAAAPTGNWTIRMSAAFHNGQRTAALPDPPRTKRFTTVATSFLHDAPGYLQRASSYARRGPSPVGSEARRQRAQAVGGHTRKPSAANRNPAARAETGGRGCPLTKVVKVTGKPAPFWSMSLTFANVQQKGRPRRGGPGRGRGPGALG